MPTLDNELTTKLLLFSIISFLIPKKLTFCAQTSSSGPLLCTGVMGPIPVTLSLQKYNYIFSSFLSGPCNNLDLAADGSTGSGGRRLVFRWSAESDPSNPSLTAVQLAAINDLNADLAARPSDQERVSLAANTSLLNIKVKFTVRVRNFLGQNASAHVVVTRVNKDVPTLSVGNTDRQHRASLDLKLQGKVIRPYVCGVCFKRGGSLTWKTSELQNLKLTGNLEIPTKSGWSLEVMNL